MAKARAECDLTSKCTNKTLRAVKRSDFSSFIKRKMKNRRNQKRLSKFSFVPFGRIWLHRNSTQFNQQLKLSSFRIGVRFFLCRCKAINRQLNDSALKSKQKVISSLITRFSLLAHFSVKLQWFAWKQMNGSRPALRILGVICCYRQAQIWHWHISKFIFCVKWLNLLRVARSWVEIERDWEIGWFW